ncbi:MAG: CPC_1213 family protein [Clostridium sp.]
MGSKLKINKKENKNISHNPRAESVKSCFGEPKAKDNEYNIRTFK